MLLPLRHPLSKRYPVFKSQRVAPLALTFVLLLAVVFSSGCKGNAPSPGTVSQGTSSSGQVPPSGGGSAHGSGSGSGAGSGQSSSSGTAPGGSEYSFAVYLDGTKLKDFTLKDVLALPQTSVTADGKEQKDPKLKEVLKAAGVTEYSKVKVLGAWQETYTLDKSAVDDTVVLDTANRGTCKLAGPSIPKDKWVRDITRIEVTR